MLTVSFCRLSSQIYDSLLFRSLNYSYSWIYKSALSAFLIFLIYFIYRSSYNYPPSKISQLFSHHGAISVGLIFRLPILTLAIHALQVPLSGFWSQLLSTYFGLVTSTSLITYPILAIYSRISLRRKSLQSWYQYSISVDILIFLMKTQQ